MSIECSVGFLLAFEEEPRGRPRFRAGVGTGNETEEEEAEEDDGFSGAAET